MIILAKNSMGDFKDLIVYQKAYSLAMNIFHLSKKFPAEERFALTDQIRRSSRSVCLYKFCRSLSPKAL
jgi:hypothetical protein